MPQDENDKIEFIEGTTNILLIAPHGHPDDDENTGELARVMAGKLGCSAIINEHYHRPKEIKGKSNEYEDVNEKNGIVNLNSVESIEEAGLKESYLGLIQRTIDNIRNNNKGNPCYVFLLHGIGDKNHKKFKFKSPILIGIGDHNDSDLAELTAQKNKVLKFAELLSSGKDSIQSEITTHRKYAALNHDQLAQYLCNRHTLSGNRISRHIQCIQLEIKFTGYRDKDNVTKTANTLAQTLIKFTDQLNLPEAIFDTEAENGNIQPLYPQVVPDNKYSNILLIAPHAHYENDGIRLGVLTRRIGQLLDCPTIVNEQFRIPRECGVSKSGKRIYEKPGIRKKIADWYDIEQAKEILQKDLIEPLKHVAEAPAKTLVVWLRDKTDKNIESLAQRAMGNGSILTNNYTFQKWTQNWDQNAGISADSLSIAKGTSFKENDVKLCVKYGIDEKSRPYTARLSTGVELFEKLNKARLTTVLLEEGHRSNQMLHWFSENDVPLEKVESITLELKGSECLDTEKNINETAEVVAKALHELSINIPEEQEDTRLVDRAFNAIFKKFNLHVEQAVDSIGNYIVDEFYRGDMELARKGQQGAHKQISLNSLIDKLSETRGAPSKSWVYNTVKLVVQSYDIEKHDPKLFQTYGKLLLSHKVLLLTQKSMEKKKELIAEIIDKNYTVKQLRERLAVDRPIKMLSLSQRITQMIQSPSKIKNPEYAEIFDTDEIAQLPLSDITELHELAEKQVEEIESDHEKLVKRYRDLITSLEKVQKDKNKPQVEQTDK